MSRSRRQSKRLRERTASRLALVASAMIVLSACQATADPAAAQPAPEQAPSIASPTEVPRPDGQPPTVASAGGVDFTLERDDIDCDEETLNEYGDTVFAVAHVVVDGILGAACFGEPDDRLTEAWWVLSAITPPDQLRDLGLFGGFGTSEDGEVTLAFVTPVDSSGSLFQMSVNLDEAESDADELMLTMAHEFSHVFSATRAELDRDVEQGECATFHNGEGCFHDDSLIAEWVALFWADGQLDDFDPFDEPSSDVGDDRCAVDGGFLGPYAASHPEEDFAEAFSAFVFQLEVDTPGLQARMDWFAGLPGLVEFRDRAIAAGLGPLQNFFPSCG